MKEANSARGRIRRIRAGVRHDQGRQCETDGRLSAVAFRKFYSFMHEQGHIDADELKELKETIKEEMPEWVGTVERYDDPDIDDPEEIWGL